jgi:hypothetical protein
MERIKRIIAMSERRSILELLDTAADCVMTGFFGMKDV